MTRQDYIFTHTSEIAERKMHTVRKIQTDEARRLWGAVATGLKSLVARMSRVAGHGQQHQN